MTQTQPRIAVRVARRADEAEGIASFELVSADGSALPRFDAGAHIEVATPGGPVRAYSLCNAPAETHRYRIAVLREPASRGGSAAMHDRVREGDVLQVGAPRNLFPLAAGASHHLLLAGGIGITPILAMAEHLSGIGADFRLHYAARSPARAAFREPLAAAPYAARVQLHFDDGAPEQRLNLPALLAHPAPGTHLYVCGPQGMIDAALAAARAAGWPEDRLHRESFGAASVATDGDAPFDLVLAGSGRVVHVPAGCSAVQALADAGVAVMTSCEQGVCGTCITRIVDGRPLHRDQFLTLEEQEAGDQFLPCCSRSLSPRLVVDL